MAPEQFNTRAQLTPAADIFALGMVAYTLLVGVAYWAEESQGGERLRAFGHRGHARPGASRR